MAVRIPLITDFDGRGIQRAKKEFAQLEGAGQKAGFLLKKALVPATAALGALAVGAKKAVDAASDLNEETSKAEVIFGDGAKEIRLFARTAARELGQSQRQALQAASTFATLGKAAGLSGKDLVGFSKDFTKLASDLASFNNTSPEDAIVAIGAALRGESEPIRRYGVLLNDATLRQKALELGLIDTVKEGLDPQNKALAAAALIMEQTGDAQGDFARTSDGFANSQRILTATIEDFQASLGQALLPILQKVLPVVKQFAQWAADNPKTFQTVAIAIAAVTTAIIALNVALALNPIVLLAGAIAGLAVVLALNWPKVKQFFIDFRNEIDETLGPLDEIIGAVFRFSNVIGKGIEGAFDRSPLFGGQLQQMRAPVRNIPQMANGGIVRSPTLALIGEAGPEAVVPLDRGPMGNVTINVNGGDPQAVVDALRRYMQINGTVPIRVS